MPGHRRPGRRGVLGKPAAGLSGVCRRSSSAPPPGGGRLGRGGRQAYTHRMDWKLELVAVPVTDVDRAKAFYVEQVGFHADHDHQVHDGLRFVQLTPPGSACSIVLAPASLRCWRAPSEVCRSSCKTPTSLGGSSSPAAWTRARSTSSPGARSSPSATPTATRGRSSSCHHETRARVRTATRVGAGRLAPTRGRLRTSHRPDEYDVRTRRAAWHRDGTRSV